MRRALLVLAGVAAVGAWLALRWLTIERVAFHWDEFALFDSVARSVRDGVLRSGGRPGLAQLALMPLVDGCRDEIAVGRGARLLWLGLTSITLAGVFALLAELLRERPQRWRDAALGLALLALLPVFLETSIQVRTDQVALAGAAWGGLLLLRSQRAPGVALSAGLLFGLGWLGSQKLGYGAALMGLLAAGRTLASGDLTPRRGAWRAALALSGFATVLLCYRAFSMWAFTLPETHASQHLVAPQLAAARDFVFPFYRHTIGYGQYAELLPTLIPHGLLLAGLVAASVLAWRRRGELRWLGLAWSVLALGLAVGLFHAAAFRYFWMTLGLFPAVAGALALEPIRRELLAGRPRWQRPAEALLWLALALPALAAQVLLLRDSQDVQLRSLHFVHRNFAEREGGFQPEGAVFCAPPQPLGIWFSQTLYQRFEGPHREAQIAWVERNFRKQPVHYLVQSFRLNQFPLELRRFFAEHYQPYRDSVFVAGSQVRGRSGQALSLELLVPGPYRWLPRDGRTPLRIGDASLAPGARIELDAGTHPARLEGDGEGVLVLAVHDAPATSPLPFYPPSGVL